MGLHRNEANLDVAKRENDVITLEDDYNPNTSEACSCLPTKAVRT